jgi:ATP-dependent DNA helicase DinG
MTVALNTYILKEAQEAMRREIALAFGNEVFFMGITNDERQVVAVKTLARGNQSQVPIHMGHNQHGNVIIHNHPGDDLSPSDADLELSAFFSSRGVGSYIVDNAVSSIYVCVEAYEKKLRVELDANEVTKVFQADGLIQNKLSHYEFRPEQLSMAHAVTQCLNQEGVYLIEAGTGTGKSFAYLVPSILYALLNKERVVISTNTINLQEQLMHKDIPFLQKTLGRKFRGTIVKGRGNYVCHRKLLSEIEHVDLFPDEDDYAVIKSIYEWSAKTRDGSLSDLNFVPHHELWERVSSEGDNCLKVKCPFFKECFFHLSRRSAAISEIIIVNHHILFADLALKLEAGDSSDALLLPPFSALIIDEAHNIEDSATSYFSRKLSKYNVQRIIKRLHTTSKSRKKKGFLNFVEHHFVKKERTVKKMIDDLRLMLATSAASIDDIFESFADFLCIYFKNKGVKENFMTLSSDVMCSIEYKDGIADNVIALKSLLDGILEKVLALTRALDKTAFKEEKQKQNDCATLRSLCAKLMDLIVCTDLFLQHDSEDLVRWIECQKQKGKGNKVEVFFRSAPIEVKDVLQKTLFSQCSRIVLTSATLSVEGTVRYIKERLGLISNASCSEIIFPSSFDYKKQVYLGVFEDMPAPTERDFNERLKAAIYKTLCLTKGKAFVLCTSYLLLNSLADQLESPLALHGITLLRQGDTTRHKILNTFKEDIDSVLFGTDSFWEGVDVEGESLSNVLITRLPFQVPNDPILEARSHRIRQRGGNPFSDYTVPQAVIKLRQGFGRLIRNKNDFGSVLIFDSRVIHKNYGRKFLKSLPECSVAVGSEDVVLQGLEKFYIDYQK